MDHQEHEVVMLNLSIMAGKLSDDRLVEERISIYFVDCETYTYKHGWGDKSENH
jgi:hypothetical protein